RRLHRAVSVDVLPHLDQCAWCARYVSELSETADAMVLLAPEAEPPPGFERRALDRILNSPRRRRWRTTKLVAITAAAAAILSVVTVRIVDQSRTPTAQVAETSSSVAMVGNGGQRVGTVNVISNSSAMTLDVNVSYGLPSGEYNVVLTRDEAKQVLGTMHVIDGQGNWSDNAPPS